MSYILDALRKSEYERQVRETPTLNPLPGTAQQSTKYPGWLWPAIILISLNLAALLFWFNRTNNKQANLEQHPSTLQPAPVAPSPEQKPPQARVTLPAPLRANKNTDPTQKIVTQTQSIADLVIPIPPIPERPPVKTPLKALSTKPTQSKLPTTKPVSAKKTENNISPEQHPIQPPVQKSSNSPPYLHTLSQGFQNRVPAIKMSVHMYSDSAKDSFAIINMTKHRTGAIISEGLKLDKITSSGLILSFEGKTFQVGHP